MVMPGGIPSPRNLGNLYKPMAYYRIYRPYTIPIKTAECQQPSSCLRTCKPECMQRFCPHTPLETLKEVQKNQSPEGRRRERLVDLLCCTVSRVYDKRFKKSRPRQANPTACKKTTTTTAQTIPKSRNSLIATYPTQPLPSSTDRWGLCQVALKKVDAKPKHV